MPAPRFVPRTLAPAGTPAGDLLRGRGGVGELLPALPDSADDLLERAGAGRGARLPASAFRTSGAGAAEKLERILGGEGVLVSTGQQPVLFGGPLLVLYKALGACATAEALEAAHGIPALPMFWVASDDHDWEEVGRVSILDPEGRPRHVVLEPPPGREGRSVGRTPTPDTIGSVIDELAQYLPSTDFSNEYLELLRGAYRSPLTLGDAFTELLARLLGNRAAAFLDSSSPAVRAAAAPLFTRVVKERESVAAALAEGEAAVRERDYEPQLHRRSGGIPVFVDGPTGRVRLLADEDGSLVEGREGARRSEAEVLETIESSPDLFSPNVALRPVLESWALPIAASILGPSEVAYWAELPPLFAWAEVPVPAVCPRPSWSLVEGKIDKVLAKLGTDPADFADGGEALTGRVTEEGLPTQVRDAVDAARRDVGASFGTLEEAVEEALPGVRSSVGAARHGAFAALDELERAVWGRVRERQAVLLEQIDKAARHLYPEGKPQERLVSPLYFLVRYGDGVLRAAAAAADAWSSGATPSVAGSRGAG